MEEMQYSLGQCPHCDVEIFGDFPQQEYETWSCRGCGQSDFCDSCPRNRCTVCNVSLCEPCTFWVDGDCYCREHVEEVLA